MEEMGGGGVDGGQEEGWRRGRGRCVEGVAFGGLWGRGRRGAVEGEVDAGKIGRLMIMVLVRKKVLFLEQKRGGK